MNTLHKKLSFWMSVLTVSIIIIVTSLLLMDNGIISRSPSGTEYDKVKIKLLTEKSERHLVHEAEITDSLAVAYMDSLLADFSLTPSDKSARLDGLCQYQIELFGHDVSYNCKLYYDYDMAYLERDNGFFEIGVDFARYIDSFLENTDITFTIDKDAVKLFKKYGWTLDYRINTIKREPDDVNTLLDFDPSVYYFAFNNELSKDIGLDMSEISTSTYVDIYRIHESMSQEYVESCIGIVVKNRGKITGAFISTGRYGTFNACSLKGNRFETVTGMSFYEWLANMVEANDVERTLSKLEPEQIIEKYFKALDEGDVATAIRCTSKKTMMENLTVNIENSELFHQSVILPLDNSVALHNKPLENIKSAKMMEIEPFEELETSAIFRMIVDVQYYEDRAASSGKDALNCYMVYETPKTGWKIESFGH